ncbi:uncharacterized protein LOC114318938 isoform X3 [Camellia sinensis]|uniref:uncharacterized protein LOC114318938 isoform X3 n=1 Tax=Camellia sinensis TaxID=4442 RepID=UPI0010366511|nr:uncharacterized protein LOC114318938 isoform X3 [Camellia sinensis]
MVIPLSDSSQSDCDFDFEVLSLSIVSTTFYNLRKIDRILQNLLQLGDSSCGVRLCGFGTLRLLRSVRSEERYFPQQIQCVHYRFYIKMRLLCITV